MKKTVKIKAWACCDMNGNPEIVWLRYPELIKAHKIIKGEFVYKITRQRKGKK